MGYFALGRVGSLRLVLSWMTIASLVFYAWAKPAHLALIVGSVVMNHVLCKAICNNRNPDGSSVGKLYITTGVVVNLALLGFFKYANFTLNSLNFLAGTSLNLARIALPLGVSYFTFQQIAYLVDAHRGKHSGHDFLQYCLFVTFFPYVTSGPIVVHSEILFQFGSAERGRYKSEDISVGLTIFFMGLFKKTVLADSIAAYVGPVFGASGIGIEPTFIEAWGGSLAYTFQLYYDFSGYSDMAVGIARLFGIILPANFDSPYIADSIIDFWRRWHISLSRFLRDYLYISLGGNRKGQFRRYVNLSLTMLLGGLWHGAGWTFVAWGGLHGFYLVINHGWRAWTKSGGKNPVKSSPLSSWVSRIITFLAVNAAWVLFRADSFPAAWRILKAMIGLNGFTNPVPAELGGIPPEWCEVVLFNPRGFMLIAVLWAIAWFMPNTQEIMRQYNPVSNLENRDIPQWKSWLVWKPCVLWAIVISAIALVAVTRMALVSAFIYYQF